MISCFVNFERASNLEIMLTRVSSAKNALLNTDPRSSLTIYIYINQKTFSSSHPLPKKGTALQVKKNSRTAHKLYKAWSRSLGLYNLTVLITGNTIMFNCLNRDSRCLESMMSSRLGLSAEAITLDLCLTLGAGFVPELARHIAACSRTSR